MRWKISPQGHDPRQIDLLAVIALVIVIAAAYVVIEHYGVHRAEPKRALVSATQIQRNQKNPPREDDPIGAGGFGFFGFGLGGGSSPVDAVVASALGASSGPVRTDSK